MPAKEPSSPETRSKTCSRASPAAIGHASLSSPTAAAARIHTSSARAGKTGCQHPTPSIGSSTPRSRSARANGSYAWSNVATGSARRRAKNAKRRRARAADRDRRPRDGRAAREPCELLKDAMVPCRLDHEVEAAEVTRWSRRSADEAIATARGRSVPSRTGGAGDRRALLAPIAPTVSVWRTRFRATSASWSTTMRSRTPARTGVTAMADPTAPARSGGPSSRSAAAGRVLRARPGASSPRRPSRSVPWREDVRVRVPPSAPLPGLAPRLLAPPPGGPAGRAPASGPERGPPTTAGTGKPSRRGPAPASRRGPQAREGAGQARRPAPRAPRGARLRAGASYGARTGTAGHRSHSAAAPFWPGRTELIAPPHDGVATGRAVERPERRHHRHGPPAVSSRATSAVPTPPRRRPRRQGRPALAECEVAACRPSG